MNRYRKGSKITNGETLAYKKTKRNGTKGFVSVTKIQTWRQSGKCAATADWFKVNPKY